MTIEMMGMSMDVDENEQVTTIIDSTSLPGLLLLSDGMTFQEFVENSSIYRRLLFQRYDEIRLTPDQQFYLAHYPDVLHLVLIVSEDSPDTIAIAPVIQRLVDASTRLALYIWRDEDDLTALDARVEDLDLSDDSDDFDVPLLLVFDEEGEFQTQWGPRPAAADTLLDAWLAQHPTYEALAEADDDENQDEYLQLLDELCYQMRVWYNSGLNQTCAEEVRELLEALQSDDSDDEGDDDGDDDGDDE